MPVPFWQPGRLYQPGTVVLPRGTNVITQTPINNADFESGNVNWVLGTGFSIGAPTGGAYEGAQALTYTALGFPTSSETTNDIRAIATAGQQITASCRARSPLGFTDKHVVSVQLVWYDSGDVELLTTNGELTEMGPEWAQLIVTGTAPADSATASVRVLVEETASISGIEIVVDAFVWDHTVQEIPNGFIYRAIQAAAGFSGVNEPDFPTTEFASVVDNEVTWRAEQGNGVVWRAFPIFQAGATEPTFPAAQGGTVEDNTILWVADSQRVIDENCPNTKQVAILASKVFAGDDDIIGFSATVNPLDWTTRDDAGYIPFGLNTYGGQPVSALGIYRSNLVAFNSKGFQMWQVDEDPANFAILDAVAIGCPYYRTPVPVSNDLVFLTEEGVRSMGIAGASTNLQAGFFGKQIDPLVQAAIAGMANEDDIHALFWPATGQYWIIFGSEAFVLTINGGQDDMSWSRYVFPSAIDNWTIADKQLFLRSGDKIWRMDRDTLVDDFGDTDTEFGGKVWWQYLDFGAIGVTKTTQGFDVVADGAFDVSIGYNQKDTADATTPHTIDGDTLTGDVIPLQVTAPSLQFRLDFAGNQAWEWSATVLYLDDFRRTS